VFCVLYSQTEAHCEAGPDSLVVPLHGAPSG